MKRHMTTILLFVVLFAGLALLLYPSFADWWNKYHSYQAVAVYNAAVEKESAEDYAAVWEAAIAYNQSLIGEDPANRLYYASEHREEYNQLLNVDGSGILGIIEIPEIAVLLPLYHSTDSAVLQVAVGHIEGTSLPTGGPSTHCAISAHRGLPSAKLFTNLDQLVPGDVFTLRVLDEVLTYEIYNIEIVLPHQVESLQIVEGQDLCTLVTCTPYGINTHRLLVHGRRVETSLAHLSAHITADALQIDPLIVMPVVAAPMILVLLIVMLVSTSPKRRKKKLAARAAIADLQKELEHMKNNEGGERP